MVTVFVPDIAEFEPLLKAAAMAGCRVRKPVHGYWRIEAERVLEFSRKELGLGPALWNSALSGGFRGRITEYGRDVMRIESEGAP
ncbi:hypothetical protein C7T35_34230 [Variovorax sp. WS11]|uniref:hypothetical protein n=1 Tax=Variovorax sp. WS11 TaxID=1105204 RepID=UPI000D0DF9C6|nr:hypothetical protein [Variovorax sp. WS11]NDZ18014.1 hypothetical protein [Variovorax sp. WS11]PSL80102.1 hypothetical protein C7T35_34230 [Variovorax sp. WS11]